MDIQPKKSSHLCRMRGHENESNKKTVTSCNDFCSINLQYLCAIVDINNMAEEEGFEPPRGVNPLAVFKTAPFSRTWVLLRVTDK